MKLKMLVLPLTTLLFYSFAVAAEETKPGLDQCVETALLNNHEYLGQKKKEAAAGVDNCPFITTFTVARI
jgi:hypothetical protein